MEPLALAQAPLCYDAGRFPSHRYSIAYLPQLREAVSFSGGPLEKQYCLRQLLAAGLGSAAPRQMAESAASGTDAQPVEAPAMRTGDQVVTESVITEKLGALLDNSDLQQTTGGL